MSSAARKNDPFHFDEIYKQAGVEDLFVKKTMGELKQKQPTGPVPSASPLRPAAATPAPRPAPNAANFDLDFLATMATPGSTPHNLSKPSSATNLTAASLSSSLQQQPQQPASQAPVKAPPSRTALDDPFALFEELPGAAPPQKHTPPPAPAPLTTGAGDQLLDFDDGHGLPPVAAGPAAPSFSLLSPTGPPPPRPPAAMAPAQPSSQSPPQPPPPPPAQKHQQQPAQAPAAAAPGPPPPDYVDHVQHRPAPPGPAVTTRPLAAGAAPALAGGTPLPPHPDMSAGSAGLHSLAPGSGSRVPSSSTAAADYRAQHIPHFRAQQPAPLYEPMSDGPERSVPSNSSNPSFSWSHAPSGSGLSGYLKSFGKKAVRAAKAGLAQLEQALEGIDQPHHAQQQQQHAGQRVPSTFGPDRGRSEFDVAQVSNDEALAWAVRLADLSPHAQQQELARMAPPLRRKVIEVLREQVRSEHEAAAAGVTSPGSAAADVGAGLGHGAVRGTASPAAPPPYGQGPSVPPPQPGSQDGDALGQQNSGPTGRPPVGAPLPPPYSDAMQHPAAAPQQQAQAAAPPPPPHADLLGIGTGDLQLPPGAVGAAAAVAATPKSAVVVDDLLGFGDNGPPPVSRSPASAPLAPSSNAAVPAATVAAASAAALPPQPPPPASVHVDDMDDFFSGGKTAPSGSSFMHGSTSAPNLRSPRAAPGSGIGSSSSAAALADMLHGSDDDGDAGADVDVSGYADLYKGDGGAADEPELRRRLRAQREAAKHAKMKAALAEKLAKDAEEAARREQQVTLKEQYKADIEAWKNRNKGNIRGLLGSLHTVLWADSGWTPVSVGDLLEPIQVKRVYMRANLLVHPDKVRQRSGSAEQVAIADMVFDVLKEAWNVFR